MRRGGRVRGGLTTGSLRWLASARADRSSSAHPLAIAGLSTIAREFRSWRGLPGREIRKRARALARELASVQPGMAYFRSWAWQWAALLRERPDGALRPAIAAWVRRHRSSLEGEPGRLAQVVRRRLPPRVRILTISRSTTIATALRALPVARRPSEVIALESLPGGEGRALVRELRRGGLPARWVPDEAAPEVVQRVDLIILGADAIYPDGSLVHKVGTRRLAAAARQVGVPVIVVAGRSKRWPAGAPRPRLPALFDLTPARLISQYWTDNVRGRSDAPLPRPRQLHEPRPPSHARSERRPTGRAGRT